MDKYHARRLILDVVEALEPAATELADLLNHPLISRSGIAPEAIGTHAAALAERGYLIDHRPGRQPLYRLTAKGRGQMAQEEDLEEFVWGDLASKFATHKQV